MDVIAQFKQTQKQSWVNFMALETLTTPAAAQLVNRARVQPGQTVLDVACGTGVVAITAALRGARVTALDLTPELLARARENAATAGVDVEWHEGDAEQLPFADATFDVVLSQFGHIFAPRPEVVTAEMLRVLKPGGTIAFSTWPPEMLVGRLFALTGRYLPPPPPGIAPPPLWGEPSIVRERLGAAVRDLSFDRGSMTVPALSPQHFRANTESGGGPMRRVVAMLKESDPEKLAAFRAEYDAITAEYIEDNLARQSFLMARATKI